MNLSITKKREALADECYSPPFRWTAARKRVREADHDSSQPLRHNLVRGNV